MKQTTALVIALLLAGCAAARPEATISFSGSEPRVGTWTPVVVERGHLHADLTDYPCPVSGMLQFTDSEIFLILAPVEGGGPSTQVVSRVEAAAAPQ